jgi:hypothetical protein
LDCFLHVFGPLGGLVTPIVVLGIALYLTPRFERKKKESDDRVKRIESTLKFSDRFQELIRDQRELNRKYSDTPAGKDPKPTPADIEEGRAWWWSFFDLQMYEFDFFQSGLVREERFIEWMRFRWHDFHPEKCEDEWKTCGVTYKEGWEWWRARKAHTRNRLIHFLTEVHNADTPGEVARVVRANAPRPGEKTQLDIESA